MTRKSSFSLKLRAIIVSVAFNYLQVYWAEAEHCNECFHMTNIFGERNVRTVRNIKTKPWSHISVPRSEFLVLGLRSLIPGHWFCFVDLESQFVGSGSWVLVSKAWVLGLSPRSWATGPGPLVLLHSIVITKCDKKWLLRVTVITKCARKLLPSVIGITKCHIKLLKSVIGIAKYDNYYKVRRNRLWYIGTYFMQLLLIWSEARLRNWNEGQINRLKDAHPLFWLKAH